MRKDFSHCTQQDDESLCGFCEHTLPAVGFGRHDDTDKLNKCVACVSFTVVHPLYHGYFIASAFSL